MQSLAPASTAAPPPTGTPSSNGVNDSGLSGGAIAGIAVGSAVGLALLGLVAWFLAHWLSRSRKQAMTERHTAHSAAPSLYAAPAPQSNMSMATSYDPYAQPVAPVTQDAYHDQNMYGYQDPAHDTGVHAAPAAAMYTQGMPAQSYVPGQAIAAPPVEYAARRQSAHRASEDPWAQAGIDPVADYGTGRSAHGYGGTGSEASPSRPSYAEWPADQDLYEEDPLEITTPARRIRRKKRSPSSSALPVNQPSEASFRTGDSDKASELPYAMPSRSLIPTHDIDADASQAAQNLRATRRYVEQSGRGHGL